MEKFSEDSFFCPLLELPGELRNRIYGYIIEDCKTRKLNKAVVAGQPNTQRVFGTANIWNHCFGLAQACRSIRSELVPLYNAHTVVCVEAEFLYDYIHTFLAVPGTSDDHITGSVVVNGPDAGDFLVTGIEEDIRVDIKPLLSLLRRANNLFIGLRDIITGEDVYYDFHAVGKSTSLSVQDTLVLIYDIVDMAAFYDYVERAMTKVEVQFDYDDRLEIIFELRPAYWEEWMGIWSKPDHPPDYRIPLELGDKVVEWGRECGMELNREEGSHLTVNYRLGT